MVTIQQVLPNGMVRLSNGQTMSYADYMKQSGLGDIPAVPQGQPMPAPSIPDAVPQQQSSYSPDPRPNPFPQVRPPAPKPAMANPSAPMANPSMPTQPFKRRGEHPLYGNNPEDTPVDPNKMPPAAAGGEPSFMDRLLSKQGIGAIGAGMLAMSQDPNLQKMGMAGIGRLQERYQGNRTLEFLKAKGVDEGTLSMLKDNPQMINAYAASMLKGESPLSTMGKLAADLKAGRITQAQFDSEVRRMESAGKTEVNVNTGANTDELRKKLQGKEGETWAAFLTAGNKAAELAGDIRLMEQLANASPTGPLSGRFLELFPEANDNAAAFQSLVKRIAPTMRVEGSGSTSDIEVKMMLDSLGSLRNSPQANRMIYDAFRKKFALNQARAEVVTKFNAGEYSYTQASAKLNEINRISIMPPELKKLTESTGVKPSGSVNRPDWVDPALWEVMTDDQKQRIGM